MKHKTPIDRGPGARGFSIIELLIAIIIIGILVSILIPVIANRAEDARIARAGQDVENLSAAEERVATDTSYMTRLYVLNDVIGGDGIPFSIPPNPSDYIDGLRDHGLAGEYYQNPRYFFVDIDTGFIPGVGSGANTGDQLYLQITRNETAFGWHGPYINWQQDNNFVDPSGNVYPDGIPDDPWGNNYLLFTREGLIKEPEGQVVTSQVFPFPEQNQGLPGLGSYDCQRFDRATILSLGRNGVPGDGSGPSNFDGGQLGQGDDIARKFGH